MKRILFVLSILFSICAEAQIKISAMPTLPGTCDTCWVPIVKGSINYKARANQLFTGGGGGGGSFNPNKGSGYRLGSPTSDSIKTLFGSWALNPDSSSNSNGITFKLDTTLLSTRAWRQKGMDSLAALINAVANIYNSNGILTGNRYLTGNNGTYNLWFDSLGSFRSTVWNSSYQSKISQDASVMVFSADDNTSSLQSTFMNFYPDGWDLKSTKNTGYYAQIYSSATDSSMSLNGKRLRFGNSISSKIFFEGTGVQRISGAGVVLLAMDSTGRQLGWTSVASGSVTDFSSGNLSPLFTTSVATSSTTPALSFTLSNASSYTLFGRGSGSGAPSYLSSIDSNWIPGLHTENYYNTKYISTRDRFGFSGEDVLMSAARSVDQNGYDFTYTGNGYIKINSGISTSTSKVQIGRNSASAFAPDLSVGEFMSNGIHTTFLWRDSMTVANLSSIPSNGIQMNRYLVQVDNNMSVEFKGGATFGSIFTLKDSIVLNPEGADAVNGMATGIFFRKRADQTTRTAIQTGIHNRSVGYGIDPANGIISSLNVQGGSGSNNFHLYGDYASFMAYQACTNTTDTIDNYYAYATFGSGNAYFGHVYNFYGSGVGGGVDTLHGIFMTGEDYNYLSNTLRIGSGTNGISDASAMLDIVSTTRGVLFTRMTAAQRLAISSPANSLLTWDTDSSRYMVNVGGTWKGLKYTDEGGAGSLFRFGIEDSIGNERKFHMNGNNFTIYNQSDAANILLNTYRPDTAYGARLYLDGADSSFQLRNNLVGIRSNAAGNKLQLLLNATSSDTTVYKPLGRSSDGTTVQMDSWPVGTGTSGLTKGTTTIASSATNRILYDSAGVLSNNANFLYNPSTSEMIVGTSPTDNGAYNFQVNGTVYMSGTYNFLGMRPTFDEYISHGDIALGSVDGTYTYNFIAAAQSYGVKYRDNSGNIPYRYYFGNGALDSAKGYSEGQWYFGGSATARARVHIAAGTATAGTAPLKFTSGTNLTTPENGAVEYNGTHLYITIGGVRYQLDQQGGSSSIATLSDVTLTSLASGDFLKYNGSAWVNRTASNVRSDLSLVIGTNVQAWDADLDSWAAVTPAAGIATFLATPSSANLITAVTDETGTGALVFGTSPTLTTPKIASGGYVADANGNELIKFTTTASAVNEVTFNNAATGANPGWLASGGDADIGIDWTTKGAGKYRFLATTSGPTEIRLFEDADNGSNYAGVIAPATLGSDVTVTLPNASSTLPIFGQQITFTGPTAARSIALPDASFTVARTDAAQTFTGSQTFASVIITSNAITASGNAATVPVTASLSTVTNNSAATLTITLTTASAVDGQITTVRILDFSAVSQTITWVNTENSSIAAPTSTNGSTTLFLTVRFMYNSATSKWRCIGYA